MTCRECIDFLGDYLSGDLPPVQRARFEEHLGICPPCQDYLATYEETIRLSRQALGAGEPPPMPEDLVQVILRAAGRGQGDSP